MKSAISMTVLAGSSTGIMAVTTQCSAGFVHKADLSGLMCVTNVNNAASCNSECCKTDESTCGGINNEKSIVCPFNQYKAGDDAWAKTPATKDNAVKVCCAAKATCAQAVCPSGYEANTNKESMVCTGDAKSCALSLGATGCCKENTKTCGGATGACTAPKFEALATGTYKDKAWKESALSAVAQFGTECCKATQKKCSDLGAAGSGASCPAGQKYKTTAAATPCKDKDGKSTTSVQDCATTKDNNKKLVCCEDDAKQCGGTSGFTCPAGKYVPKSLYGLKVGAAGADITGPEYNTKCCTTAKATCKTATCPAGYTKKAGVDAVQCDTDAKSCLKTVTICCQPDTKTCGGQTSIACPYGFFNEEAMWTKDTAKSVKDAWNAKPANATNKNINCCTARAICDSSATTTPAATATPVAPALKFSAHQKVVQQKEATGSNVLWLGCGAIAGMSILMIIQNYRSSVREGSFRASESDDADVLLGSCEE